MPSFLFKVYSNWPCFVLPKEKGFERFASKPLLWYEFRSDSGTTQNFSMGNKKPQHRC
jgi:hypothetical protein